MTNFIVPMFPYPSGYFHMGHARNYIFSDIIQRFLKITQYEETYHCLGTDAFGLPAENASITYGLNPCEWTRKNIIHIKQSLKSLSIEYNENTWINTTDINFIRLNQFIFQILFENNLIYRSEKYINWDPEDKTVLSNEQIINNRGWRSGAIIQKKLMSSWYVKISKYSEFLKNELKSINWPIQIKKIQNSWIDKVNGYIIKFHIYQKNKIYMQYDYIECFTKKPEYCYDAKFIAMAYTHELSILYIKNNNISINNNEIENLCIKTDIRCINPYNNEIISVYIAGYVIHNFATLALYGAPNLDEKDNIFAKKANILYSNIEKQQIKSIEEEASIKINNLIENKIIYSTSIYTLNDWCISRQRIWGCPIPILYCDICGPQIIIDDALNILRLKYFNFSEIKYKNINLLCKNGHKSRLEIETLDTFFDSSWYYLCYLDNVKLPYLETILDAKKFISDRLLSLPINLYIGGIEHANLHLIYTRVIIKMLSKCLNTLYIVPIENLITQGSILHTSYIDINNKYICSDEKDKANIVRLEKMSKSKLNIVKISDMLKIFKSDTIRFAIMSNMPIEVSYEWNINIFYTKEKFLNKIVSILENHSYSNVFINNYVVINQDKEIDINILNIYVSENLYNRYIKYIKYMEQYKIHNAIAIIHEIFNNIKLLNNDIDKDEHIITLLLLMYPITPNLAGNYLKNILDINKRFIYEIKYK